MTASRSVVLMYHRLSYEVADLTEGDYALPTPLFEAQMRWLPGRERRVVPLAALLDRGRPDRSVILTFDDGCDTDFTVAAPVLAELGFAGRFFVCPARLGTTGYLSWDELQQLASRGFEVGSHGLDHSPLGELADAQLRHQLVESRETLEQRLGRGVTALSLPLGSGGTRVLRAAKEVGYRFVLGSRPGVVEDVAVSAVLPRVAIRRAHGLEGFRAAVEQDVLFRAREGARYGATELARALLGTGVYRRLRRRWMRRSAASGSAAGR